MFAISMVSENDDVLLFNVPKTKTDNDNEQQ